MIQLCEGQAKVGGRIWNVLRKGRKGKYFEKWFSLGSITFSPLLTVKTYWISEKSAVTPRYFVLESKLRFADGSIFWLWKDKKGVHFTLISACLDGRTFDY